MEYQPDAQPENKTLIEEPGGHDSPSEEFAFVLEMTPSKPAEKADRYEELIMTPSLPDDKPEAFDLTLEAESIAKAEEITFEGEEETRARVRDAMKAYDEAMDQAAHAHME